MNEKQLSWYFSKGNKDYQYSEIDNFIKKGNFDPLYALFETCFHFQRELERIRSNEDINDSDFTYTAIAFASLHENMFDIVGLLNGEDKFKVDYTNVIRDNVSLTDFMGSKKNSLINIDVELFKKLGIYNANDNLETKAPIKLTHSIIKNIRNKLVHPNSKRYNTINIGGNYSSSFFTPHNTQKEFDFKSSFHSKQKFRVNKQIFLLAIDVLIESWQGSILNITNTFLNKKRKKVKTKYFKYDDFIDEASKMDKWSDEPYSIKKYTPFGTYNLLKIASYLENDDIKRIVYNATNINKFFLDRQLDEYMELEDLELNTHKKVSKYIANYIGEEHSGYAKQKIGFWSDDEYANFFPDEYIQSIHDDFKKIYPKLANNKKIDLEQKIIMFVTQDVDWNQIRLRTDKAYSTILSRPKDVEKIKSLTVESLLNEEVKK